MAMREFLMLADTWNPLKHKTEGSYISEKGDGQRCLWLPCTRGMLFQNVPFANTTRDNRNHVCTGLWSRYAKPIFAPEWFMDLLPTDIPLDGELALGRGREQFQTLMRIIRTHTPDEKAWKDVGYYIFDIPSYQMLLSSGNINNPNFQKKMEPGLLFNLGLCVSDKWYSPRRFENNYKLLSKEIEPRNFGDLKGTWAPLVQRQLPFSRYKAESEVQDELGVIVGLGGEGVMLRRPHSEWKPKRTDELLKVKALHDAEGEVIGYNYGTGKLHGMIGSVRVKSKLNDKIIEFDLSGFTDMERSVNYEWRDEAKRNPSGYTVNNASVHFPLGGNITFTYRELTQDGMPREARYLRIRPETH